MYYGRGAGKLPTASAVVSDVVDCARHQGKTIMCFWDAEDVLLTDIDNVSHRFFVRVPAEKKDAAIDLFGTVAEVSVGIASEFAFVTESIKEKELKKKLEALGGALCRIRLEDTMAEEM